MAVLGAASAVIGYQPTTTHCQNQPAAGLSHRPGGAERGCRRRPAHDTIGDVQITGREFFMGTARGTHPRPVDLTPPPIALGRTSPGRFVVSGAVRLDGSPSPIERNCRDQQHPTAPRTASAPTADHRPPRPVDQTPTRHRHRHPARPDRRPRHRHRPAGRRARPAVPAHPDRPDRTPAAPGSSSAASARSSTTTAAGSAATARAGRGGAAGLPRRRADRRLERSRQSRQRPGQTIRRSAAHRVSWCREDSCSLRSTLEAWVSTVLIEMNSSAADLAVGVAAGQQPHHLLLARGELVQLRIGRGQPAPPGAGAVAEGVQHEAGQPRREHHVAVGHPPDRVGQVRRRRWSW